jgi:transposase InsO family protein
MAAPTLRLHVRRDPELAPPPCGAHRGSMGNSSSSASMSVRRVWTSIWRGRGGHRPRAGRPFCAIMLTAYAMDLFVVPTVSFRLMFGLLTMRHDRRRILWLGTTAHPTAERIARQLVEACGWEQAPKYVVRDRDRAYGEVFSQRVRAMGIRGRPTSPRSPWQNGYVERLIGSIRRECVDHIVVLGEQHLRHVLLSYMSYYNETRAHLSLHKDAPVPRAVQAVGRVLCLPILGGLHHQYSRF